MSTPCDWHVCAQCREAIRPFDTAFIESVDSTFRTTVESTTRGGRVGFWLDGKLHHTYMPPSWAREIAARLLDAADEAEKILAEP